MRDGAVGAAGADGDEAPLVDAGSVQSNGAELDKARTALSAFVAAVAGIQGLTVRAGAGARGGAAMAAGPRAWARLMPDARTAVRQGLAGAGAYVLSGLVFLALVLLKACRWSCGRAGTESLQLKRARRSARSPTVDPAATACR